VPLLIIDDLGMRKLPVTVAEELLEIVMRRYERASTLLTSNRPLRLIQERVRAGLRNAQAKGTRLGRPRVVVDALRIASLRAQGRSWAEIVAEVKVGKGTAQRAVAGLPKIV
jgi:DNA replication protein DnaC